MKHIPPFFRLALVIVLLLPILSGCWDRLDPENMAFVIAIGVDPGPRNDYLFTFALAVPKPVGGGTSGGGSSSGSKSLAVHTVEGSNITSALLVSQSFIARRLNVSHAKAFIIGEDLARNGIIPIMGEVVRNREFRRSFHVMTTRGKAQTYINNIKPTTETDISLWFELETDPNNMGAMLPKNSRFHNFTMEIESPGTGAITMQTAPRPDIKTGTASLPSENYYSEADQLFVGNQEAGHIHRVGEVPVEFFGSAVYKGDLLTGYLNGAETRVLNMLRGEFTRTTWDFSDPSDNKLNLSISMNAQDQTKMKVERKNDRILVTFDIAMEGDLISVQSLVDYTTPKNRKKLEEAIQNQLKEQSSNLLNKTLYEWEIDCFEINNDFKSYFSTLKEWQDYHWEEHVKDIEYELNINFKIRRHGDQVGPAIEGR
ncbi:Ger(x)C family spore germination protein [Halalkalibacter nanhaiisediminis]|uniref:Ger(X)C family germination protein n=1 Tax=Halalkalibacter nanhaiisediminis TaxID=688079 RepID=A0A562QQN0_9BACI|nr:Ger(x)C family spore germination protein [Halalkalibacter nanhaiisediminis]TWI59017.1 Ger(x)C family germination protein [Halalkalibacter nanhaiisediminis]